ncbi:hypothetical protein Plhal304r1_c021g0074071 [Plasmopara halstedii]
MFFFSHQIFSSSAGSYGDNTDLNVVEKATMKKFTVHDRPQKPQAAVWATDLDKSIRKVDASTQIEGEKVWAFTSKKNNEAVKTFAIQRQKEIPFHTR